VTAWTFLAFGALLRLERDVGDTRSAVILALSLGLGALTKSFYFPWSLVVLACAWLAMRRRGARSILLSGAIWLIIVTPWCIALSGHEGHFSFGDTGRLTYIWNVNLIESPTLKVMPHGATSSTLDSVLPGVAVTPNAEGTNPIWYDPARWYSGLHPRWDPAAQLHLFSGLVTYFFSTLAPILLVVWCYFAVASRDDRRGWAAATWLVVVPSLAAIGAYCLVLMTARYVAPFLVALTVVTCFGLRWPTRVTPARIAMGVGVPTLMLLARVDTLLTLAWMNSLLAAVLIGWSFRRRGASVMIVAGVVGGLAARILQPGDLGSIPPLAGILVVAIYWLADRRAFSTHEAAAFSRTIRNGLVAGNAIFALILCGFKYYGSIEPTPAFEGESNVLSLQARAIGLAGLKAGDKVAVIGSPFEAYWVRTARLQIVGVVPPWQVPPFLKLDRAGQSTIEREFARAGAKAIVAQVAMPPVAGDTAWRPYNYIGWVKRLGTP
jgi:hypothetical protein